MSWLCKCGINNSGVNSVCAATSNRPEQEHYQTSINTFDYLMMVKAEREFNKPVTENEEKFKSFFNEHTTLVSVMTDAQLIEHIEQLEEIAFEVKAKLLSAKGASKDRSVTKKFKSDSIISPLAPDQLVTDSINKVTQRAARMSKLDKQSSRLLALGFSQKEVEDMISGLRKVAVADTEEEKQKAIDRSLLNKQPVINPFKTAPPIATESTSSDNGKGVAIPEIKPTEPASKPLLDVSSLFKKKD